MTSDSLHVLGYWWLPEHPKRRVPGRLTWDLEDGEPSSSSGNCARSNKDTVLPDGSIQKYREGRTELETQFPLIQGAPWARSLDSRDCQDVAHDWPSDRAAGAKGLARCSGGISASTEIL